MSLNFGSIKYFCVYFNDVKRQRNASSLKGTWFVTVASAGDISLSTDAPSLSYKTNIIIIKIGLHMYNLFVTLYLSVFEMTKLK